jgi:hypothetical protein
MAQVVKLTSSEIQFSPKVEGTKIKSLISKMSEEDKITFQLECEKGIPVDDVFDKLLKKLSTLEWKK